MNQHYKEIILREMKVRGWSPKTQKFYMDGLKSFIKYFQGRKPTSITLDEIKNYILHLQSKGQGPVWINMQIFSIRFFYKYVCAAGFDIRDIPKMKVPKRFPKVFSREEIKKIIDATSTIKERAIISTLYSCGLRVQELVNLKVTDVDRSQMLIHVKYGKGPKQRFVPLSKRLLRVLDQYLRVRQRSKSEYLFPGQQGGKLMLPDWCGMILRKAKKSLGFEQLAVVML